MATRPEMSTFSPQITGKNRDGTDYMPPEPFAEWSVNSDLVQGPASAIVSKGGQKSRRHFVTGVSGSFNTARIGAMHLLAGSTRIYTTHVHGSRDVEFAHPVAISEDTVVSLELAGSDTAQFGAVVLRGYTI